MVSEKAVTLLRDRYGTKPLYYTVQNGAFYYADSLQKLVDWSGLKPIVDTDALVEYFSFQNVLSDRALLKGVRILPSGCVATWDNGKLDVKRYWDYNFAPREKLDKAEVVNELRRLLRTAVERTISDSPSFGVYLSGGMDSSTIAMLSKPNLTFTCGFDVVGADEAEQKYEERKYAELVAHELERLNYQVVLNPQWVAFMPRLVRAIGELRIGQIYPDYFVGQLAGRYVKVILSGAGGDELFGGYPWHYEHAKNAESYYDFYSRLIKDADKKKFFKIPVNVKSSKESFMALWARGEESGSACQYVDINSSLHGLLVMTHGIAKDVGLEVRYPLLDNALVDYVTRIPFEWKCQNGMGKLILREAMKGIVPDVILERPKQGFAAPDSAWYRNELKSYLDDTIGKPECRIYDYLNYDYVRGCLERHYKGISNYRTLIWSLLCFEWWLRSFIA